jgi:hypothetical protein
MMHPCSHHSIPAAKAASNQLLGSALAADSNTMTHMQLAVGCCKTTYMAHVGNRRRHAAKAK